MIISVQIAVVLLLVVLAVSLYLGVRLLASTPPRAKGSGEQRSVDRGFGFVLLQASLAGLVLVLPAGVVYRRWADTGSPEAPIVSAALCLAVLGGGLLAVMIVGRRVRGRGGRGTSTGGKVDHG